MIKILHNKKGNQPQTHLGVTNKQIQSKSKCLENLSETKLILAKTPKNLVALIHGYNQSKIGVGDWTVRTMVLARKNDPRLVVDVQ